MIEGVNQMNLALFTGMPGYGEVLLILAVILLLFGAKKLPELSRSLGRSLSEFKRGKQEGARTLEEITSKTEKHNGGDSADTEKPA
jgi:sec-independent protein translocase protein TatA